MRATPKVLVFALAALALPITARAQAPTTSPDPLSFGLVRRITAIADGLDGRMSYCIVDLTSGNRISRMGDEPMPTASTIKIGILYELFAQVDEKKLRLDEVRPLTAATRVDGSGILQFLDTPSLTLTDYATLMVMLSDNSATNVLIDTVGMENVNRRMRGLGLEHYRLQRRMMDLEAAKQGRENLASACDIANLLDAIQKGRGLTAASRDAALTILRKPKGTPITRAVPSGIPVASKPGGLDGVAVDAGFVALPGRPYIFVGMTNWLDTASDGDAAIEAVARDVHAYFSRLARGGAYGRMIGQ